MAKKLIKLENGLLMEVEVATNEDGIEEISGGDDEVLDRVSTSMGTVEKMLIQSVQPIVNAYNVLNQDVVLEKAEVEVGIGFSAEGNIFIAKGNANANLKVKLVLKPKE
ncbi:MAG: Unknown protein [uncultured Sulfurovum sp.]|uniref:Trypsin-co-occurring domain-containing protein n=1 Tax=uncultured Sulfurovum sp. TaxID=269237 RepID=A0A6S6TYC3_9BACT|nr:MAG: Unknown protein [uncultured Sulfurovum sp.]